MRLLYIILHFSFQTIAKQCDESSLHKILFATSRTCRLDLRSQSNPLRWGLGRGSSLKKESCALAKNN